MHPGAMYKVENPAVLLAHLRRLPFVTLCAAPAGRPLVAHAPVVVSGEGENLTLDLHLGRGNALAAHLADGFAGLAVSLGPDTYVSPDWYESPDQAPTWNYLTVEAEGPVVPFKLSQNKGETDRRGVISALGDHPIAALMAAAIPPR